MKDSKRKYRKVFQEISGILAIGIGIVGMIFFLFGYSGSIHSVIVEREMEQVRETSHYITRTVINTFVQCIETLKIAEEMFHTDSDRPLEDYLEDLKRFRDQSGFAVVGILELDGQGIDSEGGMSSAPTDRNLTDRNLYETIRRDKVYISDILMNGNREIGQVLIAVPLHRRGTVVGTVWGQCPVSAITRKLKEDKNAEQYFQIIDSDGRYISRSENKHAFAGTLPLWEELELYEFPKGGTVEEIRSMVEAHESGQFYIWHEGQGRYVSYEPIGINNWYVFSVIVGDSLDGYVTEVRRHLEVLVLGFSAFLILIFGVILKNAYEFRHIIEGKNRELSIKSRLLWMILGRTGDIPFEIHIGEKKMELYRTYQEQDEQDSEILEDFSAEALLKKGWIKQEGYLGYKKMYDAIMAGEKTEPFVLETNFDGEWSWKKIHLIGGDQGTLIGFMEEYTERKRKEKQLQETKRKASEDGLTGLYNRSVFQIKVENALKQNEYSGNKMMAALFLLDLDHFKEVNDLFGHLMGDQVLCDMANRMRSSVRNSDFVGRLGGDEFVIFIQDAADIGSIRSCAQKLNRILTTKYEKDEGEVWVSASIGIAVVEGETTFQELYKKADVALYEAKREGRNRYQIACRSTMNGKDKKNYEGRTTENSILP